MIPYCSHKHSIPQESAPALWMNQVKAGYGDGRYAIDGVSVAIKQGASVALVGSNGAGKSTLFKVIANLLKPAQGEVKIFGHPLGACHHRVVYLPQRSEIDWEFPISVEDFVLTGRYVYLGWFHAPRSVDKEKALSCLDTLGMKAHAGKQIGQLSGGERQRVLIARAMAQEADLLLLDEPLNAVDAATRDIVRSVLSDLRRAGKTVLVATHYFSQEEGLYDQAIFLRDGRVVGKHEQNHEGECHHG